MFLERNDKRCEHIRISEENILPRWSFPCSLIITKYLLSQKQHCHHNNELNPHIDHWLEALPAYSCALWISSGDTCSLLRELAR